MPTNNQPLPVRDTQCLREAKALMDAIMATLPPTRNAEVPFSAQYDSVRELAANLGADRYRACMVRPTPPAPRR